MSKTFDPKEWATHLFSSSVSRQQMSKDDTQLMMMLLSVPTAAFEEMDVELARDEPLYRILIERLDLIDRSFEPTLTLWVMHLSKGNIGQAIMLAHAISAKAPEHKHLTMSNFCSEICQWGLPTQDALDTAWSAQKLDGINAIDNPQLWK